MNKRVESRERLEDLCKAYMDREGTLRTQGVALAMEIRQEIDRCYKLGVTVQEVRIILEKFGQFTN